jgi:hypothetical protein
VPALKKLSAVQHSLNAGSGFHFHAWVSSEDLHEELQCMIRRTNERLAEWSHSKPHSVRKEAAMLRIIIPKRNGRRKGLEWHSTLAPRTSLDDFRPQIHTREVRTEWRVSLSGALSEKFSYERN